MRIAQQSQEFLQRLFDLVHEHFQTSAAERGVIHTEEWEKEESILMDAECLVSHISGVVTKVLSPIGFDAEVCADQLESSSLFDEASLLDWMVANSTRFPNFAAYIAAIEYIRCHTLLLVKGSSGP